MAITKLYRKDTQPPVTRNEASTQANEEWFLVADEALIPIEVDVLVASLSSNNEFNFLIVGQTHPANPSLVVTQAVVGMAADKTFTKYTITTTLTNNKASIDSSVKPSRAQDSYNFGRADYEDIVTTTTYASRAKTGLKAAAGTSIENTNGRGIIVSESKNLIRAVIIRNEDDYDLGIAAEHKGKINEGRVTIVGSTFQAGQCKLVEWAGQDAYDSEGKLYWRVTYEILISDDPAFFERSFVMRGTVDANGKPADIAAGYISDTDYKLDADGFFLSLADQKDPTKFISKSFATIEQSKWGPAIQLSDSPNENITNLLGDFGFGLVK